ncbi:hypothetical protein [Roseibium aggregatum]|uniref:Phosphoribulokinase/uridine kinase domain-containing protein n=1 Tax=Roseibium aggregatum TaxID=187304 RepID=A0A939EA09_9HYPH|nr:hypothetical protein [Roseibium aggregatum]MBN9668916.1 hypothetical protein [Roseibium aggregatum]
MQANTAAVRSAEELVRHLEAKVCGTEVLVVGVCGVAGAGKTTLCHQLVEACSFDAVRLDCDRFSSLSHAERQARIREAKAEGNRDRIELTENPRNWYSFTDIIAAIRDLRSCRVHTSHRAWNKKTGELDDTYQVTLAEAGPSMLFCDCIYLLHPAIRTELDVAVLVDTPGSLVAERGLLRSKGNSALAAYGETLRRKYSVPYFKTFGGHADLIYRAGS